MNEFLKMSFVGDIMCEKPLLKASKTKAGYCYTGVFKYIKNKFSKSDVVIGNLETVFAGKDAKYTSELYSFNTPDSFLEELAAAGVTHVTVANNHCLDRDVDGLNRTLDLLDEFGIEHFGAYRSIEEKNKLELIKCGDKSIGIVNYTYGTNVMENGIIFTEKDDFRVNILKDQTNELNKFNKSLQINTLRAKVALFMRNFTNLEQRMKVKRFLGILHNRPVIDHFKPEEVYEPYISKMLADVERAKENADCVIACIHCGGLFNETVGGYTEYIVNLLKETGVDAIVGNHPHIVQKAELGNDKCKFVAYSLGNFSISPSSVYVIKDNLPEYSIMLHFYFSKETADIEKISFSILKIVEDKKGNLTIYPVEDLYDILDAAAKHQLIQDCTFIYNTFNQKKEKFINIEAEYFII